MGEKCAQSMSKQNDGERVRSERASTGELHTAVRKNIYLKR